MRDYVNIEYLLEYTLCDVIKCILIDHPFKDLGCSPYFGDVIILWHKYREMMVILLLVFE